MAIYRPGSKQGRERRTRERRRKKKAGREMEKEGGRKSEEGGGVKHPTTHFPLKSLSSDPNMGKPRAASVAALQPEILE